MKAVTEAKAAIKDAIAERDKLVSERCGNMFFGPPGLEEQLKILQSDVNLSFWCLNRILTALEECFPDNGGCSSGEK